MFWLENEVVVHLGSQQLCNWLSSAAVTQTMLDSFPKIRPPFSKVVVHVNHGNSCRPRPLCERSESLRGRKGLFQHLLSALEIQIVDDRSEERRVGKECRSR